jgi:hypothetical protein
MCLAQLSGLFKLEKPIFRYLLVFRFRDEKMISQIQPSCVSFSWINNGEFNNVFA